MNLDKHRYQQYTHHKFRGEVRRIPLTYRNCFLYSILMLK